MSNEIVKYDNIMNQMRFENFTKADLNLLMAVCSRMRDTNGLECSFGYDYLMDLTGWDKTQSLTKFHNNLGHMNLRLAQMMTRNFDLDASRSITITLFDRFARDKDTRTLTVSLTRTGKKVLCGLVKGFTRFELDEYIQISGKAAKLLYQQIKQRYRLTGKFWQPTVDEIRIALDVPDDYETWRIYSKVVKPAVIELQKCKGLEDLAVIAIKSGKSIKGYRFTWSVPEDMEIVDTPENDQDEEEPIVVQFDRYMNPLHLQLLNIPLPSTPSFDDEHPRHGFFGTMPRGPVSYYNTLI